MPLSALPLRSPGYLHARGNHVAALVVSLALLSVGPLPAAQIQSGPAGSITGTVRVQRSPPRRRASRYAGGRIQAATRVQDLPALVYVRGLVQSGVDGGPIRVMAQKDTAFVPGVLAILPGTTVEFTNDDAFFHNVFSYSQVQRFDLGRYPEGQSKSVTFAETGVVKVYCEVHDFMRAVIHVVENLFHAIVSEDGSFSINGVPPGEYELVVWHADMDEQVVPVTITDGGTATVEVTLR